MLAGVCVLTACPDNNDEPDSGTPDTGIHADARADSGPAADTGVDSGVDPDAEPSDAPNGDAMPGDAPALDAEPDASTAGEVIVRAPEGFPMTVVFQDPTGAVISTKTSTLGEVSEIVVPGSMITSVPLIFTGKGPSRTTIVTITGVEPGEIYELLQGFGQQVIGDVELALPGPYAGGFYYTADFGCGEIFVDPMVPQTYGVESRCAGTSSTSISVLAYVRDSKDALLAYSYVENAPVSSTTVNTATLGPWQTVFETTDVQLTNPQAEAGYARVTYAVRKNGADLLPVAQNMLDPNMAETLSFDIAPVGDGASTRIAAEYRAGGVSFLNIAAARTSPMTVDLSAELLGVVMDATSTTTPGDPERPTVSWTPLAGVDAAILNVRMSNPDIDWVVTLRGDNTPFKLPELSDEYADLRPTVDTAIDATFNVMIEVNTVPDYRAYRRTFGHYLLFDDPSLGIPNAPLGTRFRMSQFPGFFSDIR
jgi:hypothetical protein